MVAAGRLGEEQGLVGPIDAVLDADLRIQQCEPERRGHAQVDPTWPGDQSHSGEALADVPDHRLSGGQVGPGERDHELVATVAKHLVSGPKVIEEVPHDTGQDLVARLVTARIVDLLEVVQVHEHDAAWLDVTPCNLLPFAQRRQHFHSIVGARQCITVPQLALDLLHQGLDLQVQSRACRDQVLVIRPHDRRIGSAGQQQSRPDTMQALVLDLHRDECRLRPQFVGGPLVIPLPETAESMRVLRQVVRVARQPADDRAQQVIVPLGVVMCRLFKLLQRPAQHGRVHPEHPGSPRWSRASILPGDSRHKTSERHVDPDSRSMHHRFRTCQARRPLA